MEIFRDLSISIEPDALATLADRIEQAPPAGWTRDRAAEAKVRAASVLKPRPTFCFSCAPDGERPAATLILTQKDPGTFFVANILPLAKHQLTHGEYNTILEDFFERLVKPCTGPDGVTASLSDNQVELEHWMSHGTAELLRRFSASANRGTGSAHPSDRERWNAFVVAAHSDGCKMDAAELLRWLVEVDGWAPEVADQLAIEYEYGRELLAFAEGHRRSA
ncbi:MAG: hypothetical protein L0Z62_48485 [Gemmataceae bacterium]|nr:hypothetical protein [Gemmataceae bacterium]